MKEKIILCFKIYQTAEEDQPSKEPLTQNAISGCCRDSATGFIYRVFFGKILAENSRLHAAEDSSEWWLGLITHSNRRGAEKHEHAHINMHAQATGSTQRCSHTHTYTPVKPPVLIG